MAVNEEDRIVRFATIKRNPERLPLDVDMLAGHIDRFLAQHRRFSDWRVERVAIAPRIDGPIRALLEHRGVIPRDITDLIQGL